MQGILYKQGEKGLVKGWKKRWCSLKRGETKLYYSEEKGAEHINYINLLEALSVEISDKNRGKEGYFGFQIITAERRWYLCAPSSKARDIWIKTIKPIIDNKEKMAREKATKRNSLTVSMDDLPISSTVTTEKRSRFKHAKSESTPSMSKKMQEQKNKEEGVVPLPASPFVTDVTLIVPLNVVSVPRDSDKKLEQVTQQPTKTILNNNNNVNNSNNFEENVNNENTEKCRYK